MRLNNKGIYLVQVMAASIVLSYAILIISNNINNMIQLNEVTSDRSEAFNNAELLANHFTIIENSGLADALNPDGTEVSVYTLADCFIEDGPLRQVLEDSSENSSYCESLFAPSYNHQYEEGDIVLYIFESVVENFNYIIAEDYPPAITEYAQNYTADYYSTGLSAYTVDNVVVIVYFFNDAYIAYGEVMIYEN